MTVLCMPPITSGYSVMKFVPILQDQLTFGRREAVLKLLVAWLGVVPARALEARRGVSLQRAIFEATDEPVARCPVVVDPLPHVLGHGPPVQSHDARCVSAPALGAPADHFDLRVGRCHATSFALLPLGHKLTIRRPPSRSLAPLGKYSREIRCAVGVSPVRSSAACDPLGR